MLPTKDKAKELVDKFFKIIGGISYFEWQQAKQCALICVNELIQEFNFNAANEEAKSYWIEVKKEINKL
jgi:hypothetical protein